MKLPDPRIMWLWTCLGTIFINIVFGWTIKDTINTTSLDIKRSEELLSQAAIINQETMGYVQDSKVQLNEIATVLQWDIQEGMNRSLDHFDNMVNASGDAIQFKMILLQKVHQLEQEQHQLQEQQKQLEGKHRES